jgi:hypothetical protein
VRIKATRRIPRIESIGIIIDEKEEGSQFETYYWIAKELVETGIAIYMEDEISGEDWTQIHFRERFNPLAPPAALPEEFYKKVHLTLMNSKKEESGGNNRDIYNRYKAWYRDILESRIGKVVRLASAEAGGNGKNLEPEEAELYEGLRDIIVKWRDKMRKIGGD